MCVRGSANPIASRLGRCLECPRILRHSSQLRLRPIRDREVVMLAFACLFTVLAVLGSLVGAGTVGNSIGAHHLTSYGWALCINATSIALLFLYIRFHQKKSPCL
jgi:hypothetical protein